MLLDSLNVLLEIMSVFLCIYTIYEKKFVVSKATILIIILDELICNFINYRDFSNLWVSVVYIAILGYCIFEFDVSVKEYIINTFLLIVIIGLSQMSSIILFLYIIPDMRVGEHFTIFLNGLSLVIVFLIGHFVNMKKIKTIFLENKILFSCVLLIDSLGIIVLLIKYRASLRLTAIEYFGSTVVIVFICILFYQWIKQKEENTKKEIDLKLYEIYRDSFDGILQEIREKQHEYKNHIQAIYNQHYICKNYDELVNMQREYCEQLSDQNEYFELLKCKNVVIAGFLYGKFAEAQKKQCYIDYKIEVKQQRFAVPVYLIIEVIGILWDNAMEAVDHLSEKRIGLIIADNDNVLKIETKNETCLTNISEVMKFFKKNYSTKGEGRGIGLNKIKKYSSMYKWDILADLETVEEKNLLRIGVLINLAIK